MRVQNGARRSKKVHKVPYGFESFTKNHEGSKRFKEVQEGFRMFQKVLEGSIRSELCLFEVKIMTFWTLVKMHHLQNQRNFWSIIPYHIPMDSCFKILPARPLGPSTR